MFVCTYVCWCVCFVCVYSHFKLSASLSSKPQQCRKLSVLHQMVSWVSCVCVCVCVCVCLCMDFYSIFIYICTVCTYVRTYVRMHTGFLLRTASAAPSFLALHSLHCHIYTVLTWPSRALIYIILINLRTFLFELSEAASDMYLSCPRQPQIRI